MRRKITSLSEQDCFPERPHPKDLAEWIGLDTIATRRGTRERVEDFALRHTQALPRDVILLGNYVGVQIHDVMASGRSHLSEGEFREVVENVGTACGLTQILATANQAAAEGDDDRAIPIGFEAQQAPNDEYRRRRAEELLEIIRSAPSLRIGVEDLELIREQGRTHFGCTDLPSILWQAGLIAYVENGRDVFHRSDFQSQFSLPRGKESYAFHPTMRECAGLEPSGRLVEVI